MKSKEEIEQLAKQLCNIPIDLVIDEEERYYKNLDKYDGIIQGYTQCQQDMDDEILDELEKFAIEYEKSMSDKRYTEEDIRNAIREGRNSIHFENDGSWWEDETVEEDFINSLNKKD